jgi:epsilon-lactone hydrolase
MKASRDCLAAAAAVAIAMILSSPALAQSTPLAPRELPARTIPVPDTVSPQMQKLIATPLTPTWNVIPTTSEEWKTQVNAVTVATMAGLPALREALHVKVEPTTLDGVKAYMVTPEDIAPQNRNRLLLHVHGGCFVSFPGEAGTVEAVYMAGFGHFKVISVDYRMPPDHPYPAALDDAMTAWKAVTKMADPRNMAIFGSSAGGALTLSMIHRAKQDRLPLPAAIAPGTPMSDLTGSGDSFRTNALLDNVLVAYGANCDRRAALYANGQTFATRCSPRCSATCTAFHLRSSPAGPAIFCSAIRCARIASCGKPASKRSCRYTKGRRTRNIIAT